LKVQRAKGKVELESLELIDIYGKRLELWNPGTIGTYETPGTPGTSGTSGTPGTSGTSGTRNLEPGTWNQELNISHLPAGIYLIRITSENQTIVKKIIKI
jgi:hypothetical protein